MKLGLFSKIFFLTVADKHAPVATRRVRGFSVPWLTPSIKELMTERDYHHKKAIKTNQELHWSKYKRLRNTVTEQENEESEIGLLFFSLNRNPRPKNNVENPERNHAKQENCRCIKNRQFVCIKVQSLLHFHRRQTVNVFD